ncbi:MAG: hypothetical protein U5K28_10870 [Halobacteriales archaeon]|nr:hypothetical protein [Halobacteriales archaeon]
MGSFIPDGVGHVAVATAVGPRVERKLQPVGGEFTQLVVGVARGETDTTVAGALVQR